MEEFFATAVMDLIIDINKAAFSGIIGRIKLYFIKKKLKKNIFNEILKKYGDRVFYNDLDHFLADNNVICSIIKNCCDTSVFEYKSKSQIITYYVQLFVEQQPKYSRYHYEIRYIIQKYFEVIYLTLNNPKNDDTRVISNIAKELAYEIECELQNIKQMIVRLDKKVDGIIPDSEKDIEKLFIDDYRKHLLCLYPSYPIADYLERKIYPKSESNSKIDALDALLTERNILVLGEAGYGKTYEAITLLKKACLNERASELIPVLLSLQEYGLLYSDIIGGIKYKLASFCEGDIDKLIEKQFKSGNFLLIFDGVDDITQNVFRTKFYAEFKDLSSKYSNNYFFVTSRFNRYHGELGENEQYYLTEIQEDTIRQELQKEEIYVNIPRSYYKLFSNPFFLSVGKSVLKQSANQEIFNRSKLFEELFQKLYGGISQQCRKTENIPLTYSDAIKILGDLSYNTFLQPSYSYIEFDQYISKLVKENKTSVINSFVSSGLFKIEDKVIFTHKLLKEYCVAYYLVQKFPLSENFEMYLKLVEKDEWKEVFIFAGGIFNDLQLQDEFLDFVMEYNLPLYVECVNAKSDINESENSAKRLLTQILRTYRFIIDKYFAPIEHRFDPIHPIDFYKTEYDKKIGIIGSLSKDKKYLSYWFDFFSNEEEDVQCLSEQELKDRYKDFEKKSIFNRRAFFSYGINMQLSGLSEDSGRKIAIDLIKNRLKKIVDDKELIESKYLLCERVSCYQKKLKELKEIDSLEEMQSIIDSKINKALETSPNLMGYRYNGVDIIPLRDLLFYLNQDKTIFLDCILPGADMPFPASGSCFTWELYSKERKEQRLELFFYFHEISYIIMVENNFPNLKKYFARFKDAPYQVIVEINHKEDANPRDFTSEPSIQYFYIAAPTNDIPLPQIKRVNEKNFSNHDEIVKEIQDSYLKQGRTANRLVTTRARFTITTTSRRTCENNPLSDYVYRSIKESLKDVFGPLR